MTAKFSPARDKIESLVAEQNAVFEQGESRLAAGKMTAQFAGPTNRLESFVADANVEFITGKGDNLTTGTGEKMVYTAANNSMELIGNPVVKLPRGIVIPGGDVIVWDLANNKVKAKGYNKITLTGEALKPTGSLSPKP